MPALGGAGRPHRLADQRPARALLRREARRPAAATPPRARCPAHPAACSCRTADARDASGAIAFQLSSSSVWSSAGSTSGAVRQAEHGPRSARVAAGSAAGDAGDDHRRPGRAGRSRAPRASSRRLRCATGETSRCSARCAGQNSVTMLQELQRLRPVLGELLGHQRRRCARARRPRSPSCPSAGPARGPACAACAGVRRPCRHSGADRHRARRRALALRPSAAPAGQHQLPLDLADHARRAAPGAGARSPPTPAIRSSLPRPRQIGLILGSSTARRRRPQERLLQRARGPPRRQQQRDVGELAADPAACRPAPADRRPAALAPAPSGTACPAATV